VLGAAGTRSFVRFSPVHHLPITVITLGTSSLVLNTIMLELTAWPCQEFRSKEFGWAILRGAPCSRSSLFTDRIGRKDEER
jgi:uncharacterized membrane protein YvlD (DUF360 family)